MTNDINDILAKKRAWRKGDKDRRLKDGTLAERKGMADILRAGRTIEERLKPLEKEKEPNAIILGLCLILAFLMMSVFCKGCQAQTINTERLANAIYKTENSKTWPYGIKHHYKHTTPRQACLNTIKHAEHHWNGQGDFIVFLGRTYSPPSINPNWVRLVKYFYQNPL